jgi:hypothetical protein
VLILLRFVFTAIIYHAKNAVDRRSFCHPA